MPSSSSRNARPRATSEQVSRRPSTMGTKTGPSNQKPAVGSSGDGHVSSSASTSRGGSHSTLQWGHLKGAHVACSRARLRQRAWKSSRSVPPHGGGVSAPLCRHITQSSLEWAIVSPSHTACVDIHKRGGAHVAHQRPRVELHLTRGLAPAPRRSTRTSCSPCPSTAPGCFHNMVRQRAVSCWNQRGWLLGKRLGNK